MAKFPRGHAATKKLIAGCAANGVGIDSLPDAPTFRYYPAAPNAGADSFTNGEDSNWRNSLSPSARGSVLCGKAKPKDIRNWTPARTSLDPQYTVAMAGDDAELTDARSSYAAGNPAPLREYLAAQAEARRTAAAQWVQFDLERLAA